MRLVLTNIATVTFAKNREFRIITPPRPLHKAYNDRPRLSAVLLELDGGNPNFVLVFFVLCTETTRLRRKCETEEWYTAFLLLAASAHHDNY